MFDVVEKKQDTCKTHGEFTNRLTNYGTLGKRWSGCGKCAEAERQAGIEQAKREHEEMMRGQKTRSLLREARVPEKFRHKTFGGFEEVSSGAKKNKAAIIDYLETVCGDCHEGKSLIMVGKLGNGKTHLACCLLMETIKRTGKSGKYATFSEIVRRVKSSWRKDSQESEEDLYDSLARPHLLVIDEVGMQNFTDFEQTVAYEVINARYLKEKPTVIITNLAASELSGTIGERSVDRLRENGGKALSFDWGSYRSGGAK